jgi:Hg(II)-responsive transcriptional regulator
MTTLKIGQLAKEADVNVETIRYYEGRGLMPEPPRRPSGYREYSQDSVARIRFIKSAQSLGFSLREIDRLLALRVDAVTQCEDVRRQAQAKLDEINEKIRARQQLQGALAELVAACDRGGPQGECPILQALENQASHTI